MPHGQRHDTYVESTWQKEILREALDYVALLRSCWIENHKIKHKKDKSRSYIKGKSQLCQVAVIEQSKFDIAAYVERCGAVRNRDKSTNCSKRLCIVIRSYSNNTKV